MTQPNSQNSADVPTDHLPSRFAGWMVFPLAVLGFLGLLGGLTLPFYWKADHPEVLMLLAADSSPGTEELLRTSLAEEGPFVTRLRLQSIEEADGNVSIGLSAALQRALERAGDNQPSGLSGWRPFILPASTAQPIPSPRDDADETLLTADEVSVRPPGFLFSLLDPGNQTLLSTTLESAQDENLDWLLRHRRITTTAHFLPVDQPGGQPLAAIILATGWLLHEEVFSPRLASEIIAEAQRAVLHDDLTAMEEIYLDLFTFTARFGYEEWRALAGTWANRSALRESAHLLRVQPDETDLLAGAFLWAGESGGIARFLLHSTGETGLSSLRLALRLDPLLVSHLGQTQRPLAFPRFPLESTWWNHALVFSLAESFPLGFPGLRYLLIGLGFFFLLAAWQVLMREDVLSVFPFHRAFSVARSLLLAVPFTLVVFLITEPFLFPDGLNNPFQLQFFAESDPLPSDQSSTLWGLTMDEITYLSLLIFFVMQVVVYMICLIKLAEVKRQQMDSVTKLRLLENEENLFDTGLYVGLAGTVGSLIFLALGIVEPSLMAAYASTLFGIVFVAALKILHVRPFKRRLILESRGI